MESNEPAAKQKCVRCGDELPEGVRYCVACGCHNVDPTAAAMTAMQCEEQSKKRIAFLKAFSWFRGLRR